jgi:hypothetical protein
MTRRTSFIAAVLLILVATGSAFGSTFTFQPSSPDLTSLDHFAYYTWGINWSIPTGDTITSASLKFAQLYNFDNNPNSLFVHLLPSGTAGVVTGADSGAIADQFLGQGTVLVEYDNLNTTPQDRTYSFTGANLTTLASYVSDGNFGLGIDPDCHYYDTGVTLTIVTTHNAGSGDTGVPEPASAMLSLSALGALGLAALRRNRKLA